MPIIERDEQLQYIQLWEQSGLSKAEFCRRIGIAYSNFMNWCYKNTHNVNHISVDQHEDTASQQIVPVSLTEGSAEPEPASRLIIHLKDSLLEIPPGFPSDEVEKIIKFLHA
ncbi:MAG: hypothetical protein J5861_04600 [Desulfovibrio sp.]|nr:hypothetical protein [Desulfovibrio sp.]